MSASQSTPYPLRMPEDLREQVAALAKAHNHSLNTELVLLLRQATAAQPAEPSTQIDMDALAESLANLLVDKLSLKKLD